MEMHPPILKQNEKQACGKNWIKRLPPCSIREIFEPSATILKPVHQVMFFCDNEVVCNVKRNEKLIEHLWFEPAICSPYTRLELFFNENHRWRSSCTGRILAQNQVSDKKT